MTDDIVTRLREKYSGQLPICSEAADEIERLRADLENVRDMNKQLTEELDKFYSEDELNADWE